MNEVERWIYLDGPEPERIRPLLDALRDLPPATPQDRERMARAFFERLDATLQRDPEQQGAQDGQETQAEPSAGGAEDEPPRRAPARLIGEEERREETIAALDERRDAAPTPAPAAGAPEGLTGTAMALDLPAEVWKEAGKLPFKPASPGQSASGQGTAKTLQMPVMRGLGDMVPVGHDSIMKAVAALPFAGSTVGAGFVPFPPSSSRSTRRSVRSFRCGRSFRRRSCASTRC